MTDMTSELSTNTLTAHPYWPFPQPLAGVQLYSCSFDPDSPPGNAFAQAGIEAPVHIQQAVAKRQNEFLAGRLCARAALSACAGLPIAPGMDEQRAPLWPTGLCGSITHSHGWAAAVVARQQHWLGLGLDAEPLMSAERAIRLASRILRPEELKRLSGLPEQQRAWLVSLTFSGKESLFKALYPLVRQRFHLQDAELLHWQPDGQLQLRLLRDLGPHWPVGSLVQGQFVCVGSLLLSLLALAPAPHQRDSHRHEYPAGSTVESDQILHVVFQRPSGASLGQSRAGQKLPPLVDKR